MSGDTGAGSAENLMEVVTEESNSNKSSHACINGEAVKEAMALFSSLASY